MNIQLKPESFLEQLTPAALRALEVAACWRALPREDVLPIPALLLGLLSEDECRAAAILASANIDEAAIHAQWPQLTRRQNDSHREGSDFGDASLEVEIPNALLSAARQLRRRLIGDGRGQELASEHLLFMGASSCDDLRAWLAQRSLDLEKLDSTLTGVASELHGLSEEAIPIDIPEVSRTTTRKPRTSRSAKKASQASQASPPAARTPATTSTAPAFSKTRARTNETPSLAATASADIPDLSSTASPAAVLRIVDAAANRAGEALRTLEDDLRFVRNDALLARQLKQLRHDLRSALDQLPAVERLAARDTIGDVGTTIALPSEQHRASLDDVLHAAWKRLQEALRSLEEYGKLLGSPLPTATLSAACEQIRYRSYTLEKAMGMIARGRERLDHARLYVLIEGGASCEELAQQAKALISAGVDVLQLRDKQLPDRELLQRGRTLREVTRATGALLILNDRPDLAALCQADGVHVGQDELAVADVRTIVGPQMLIGVLTHSPEQLLRAVLDGANYVGLGPTFPSGTKQFEHFPGLDYLRYAAADTNIPAFAIGGITQENLDSVLNCGITRVAIGRAITAANDPAAAAREIRARMAKRSGDGIIEA